MECLGYEFRCKDRDLSPLIDVVHPPKDMMVIGIGVISSPNAKRHMEGSKVGPGCRSLEICGVMGLPYQHGLK